MAIRFRCPNPDCRYVMTTRDEHAGKKVVCPKCKKRLAVPSAAKAKPNSAAVKPAEAPAPEPPPNLEELAAAALADEAANGKAAEAEPQTIDFTCEFCETQVHAPRAEAGKRMQCPNPECRRLIKVPTPKEEKPKDWRDLAKKGPTVAQMMQEAKIDEAAWGTQTDKIRAGSAALREAGALPEAPVEPVGVRGWIRRGMWATGAIAVAAVALLLFSRVRTDVQEKNFLHTIQPYLQEAAADGKVAVREPVLKGELYRVIAEYKTRHDKQWEALQPLQAALASVRQPGRTIPVEQELFLGDLALTITELGGSEQDEIAKEKYHWKGDKLRPELLRALETIRAPEARAMALRTLITRLLEKKQPELAVGLASQMSNPEKGRRPPATSQLVVLLLLSDKAKDAENLVRPPSPKEIPELLARVGYAEYYARKGSLGEAQELAFAKGPPQDQLEACVGVAQVLLQGADAKAENALPFVERALEIAGDGNKLKASPWLLLQTIRVGSRVKGGAAVANLVKALPPEFRPRAYYEILRADLAASAAPLPSTSLGEIKGANPDSPSLDLGWEALARHAARVGNPRDVRDEAASEDNARFRPMIEAGLALGEMDRAR